MKFTTTTKGLLAAAAMLAASAHAADAAYTNRAAWSANSTVSSTVDFNAGTDQAYRGNSYTEGAVNFTASSGAFSIYGIGYDASYHPNGYLDLEGSSLGMHFGAGVTAVGFDFGAFYDNAVSLFVTLNDGSTFTANAPSSAYGFFGVTSDSPITSIAFSTGNAFTAFDNVSVGNAVSSVPEPGSLAMFGLGALGLLAARRKKSA
jgi:hypothetical protein